MAISLSLMQEAPMKNQQRLNKETQSHTTRWSFFFNRLNSSRFSVKKLQYVVDKTTYCSTENDNLSLMKVIFLVYFRR